MLVIMLEIMVMIMLKIMLVSSSQVAYSGGRRLRRWTALREWLRSTNVVLVEWLSASLKVYQREKTRPVEIVKSSTRKKSYFYRCWMPSSTCSRHWDNVFPGGTLNILDIFQLRKCVRIPLFLEQRLQLKVTNRSSTCSTKRRAPLELIRTWSLTRWLFATIAIKPF